MAVRQALEEIRRGIDSAARDSGRGKEEIRLVAVSKTFPASAVLEAYQAGHRDFGESRVQEWAEKREELPGDIRWHFIGHVQSNKARELIGKVSLIHSLDSLRLADTLEKYSREAGQETAVLLQVKTTHEPAKTGFSEDELEAFFARAGAYQFLRVQGLMTVGPLTEDEKQVRGSFRQLNTLAEKWRKKTGLPLQWLSMGMSHDYKIALREGANMLRIGSAIFGERK